MLTISNNNYSFTNFRALVPISEYKGPILKLTKKDKELISKYNAQIADYEGQMYTLQKQLMARNLSYELSNYFQFKINDIGTSISFLKGKIREIKINRLQQQNGCSSMNNIE